MLNIHGISLESNAYFPIKNISVYLIQKSRQKWTQTTKFIYSSFPQHHSYRNTHAFLLGNWMKKYFEEKNKIKRGNIELGDLDRTLVSKPRVTLLCMTVASPSALPGFISRNILENTCISRACINIFLFITYSKCWKIIKNNRQSKIARFVYLIRIFCIKKAFKQSKNNSNMTYFQRNHTRYFFA